MVVWCMINIMLDCEMNKCKVQSTAVKGEIVGKNLMAYLVDFEEYAKKQGYKLDKNPKWVSKYECVDAE